MFLHNIKGVKTFLSRNIRKKGLKMFSPFQYCVVILLLHKYKPVLLVLLNRLVAARRFTADLSTKYHHRICTMLYTQNSRLHWQKSFWEFVYKMVCIVNFLAGKIQRVPLYHFLSKKLPGETLCKFFQIFPPKVLEYRGNIFNDTFVINSIEFHLTN